MSDYSVLKQIKLSARHRPTGRTRHYFGNQLLPAPAMLQITKYADDPGFYLLYFDPDGKELTDTYHDSVEQAMAQATREFGVEPAEWV